MTPAEIIAQVRNLIQDSATPYRNSETVLLGYVNQAVRRTLILRPDLFATVAEIPTTANSAAQDMPADSVRLIEIYHVKNGNVVTEVNRETLDQSCPSWVSDPAGTPYNYMRHVRNPNKYFLYPRPAAGVVLIGEYAKVPQEYSISDNITVLPEAYMPVLVDCVVFLAESIDDEHANSGRAKLFLEAYTGALGAGLSSRKLTDARDAGMDKGTVI